ncbi:MAG: nucleotide exchange factor GrpE [Selenomonadaceae bacterium]|nr:nucleotide exchange factor GrpE [Selenomonadaceae bacterium]
MDSSRQLEIRRKDNAQKISAWHDEQNKLAQFVKDLQAPAQKLLEDFRNFSNNITENYIVQFAMRQIELFNLISDNFSWHESRAINAQNPNYYEAVSNYKVYLEMIIDALADFGIEEISSDAGTRFDGRIHDVKNTKNFYPQSALIKKSLRTGFRYGDLILQKEEVEV